MIKKEKEYVLGLGNCMSEMNDIRDGSVDLILTDPPYNLGLFMKNRDTNLGALRENHFSAQNWDSAEPDVWEELMHKFFKESSRVLKKRGAMIMFMSIIRVETIIKIAEQYGFYYKTTGIWHKLNPMPRNMNLHFINSTEAWIYFINKDKTGTFNNEGKPFHDFIETPNINPREQQEGRHPTQKPEAILSHFIKLLTNKNDLVLDPFMGSGSTGFAALKEGRRFYGIELEEKYYTIATKKLGGYK